jgi:hypothetical protein
VAVVELEAQQGVEQGGDPLERPGAGAQRRRTLLDGRAHRLQASLEERADEPRAVAEGPEERSLAHSGGRRDVGHGDGLGARAIGEEGVGPEALSHDDVAAIVSEATGRPVTHVRVSAEAVRERLASQVPPEFAALLADLDRTIAQGAEDRTTDTVRRLTGRAPHGLRAVIEREAAATP